MAISKSFAMEPMNVTLRLDGVFCDRSHGRSPALELQNHNAELACHNAFWALQNDILMRSLVENAYQAMQLNASRLAMAVPPGLTKECGLNLSDDSTTCSVSDEVSSTHSETQLVDEKPLTQLIIKHLRDDFTRAKLLDFLHGVGYKGKYDVVYLPTSFDTGKCFQYAFVNFLSEEIAQQFQMQLQGCADDDIFGQEQCEVSWSECQGLANIIHKYRNSPVMHPSVPDECKPMLFVDGSAAPFPAPTKKITKPRLNRSLH